MLPRAVSIFMLVAIGVVGILLLSMIPVLLEDTRATRGPAIMLGVLWIGLVASLVITLIAGQRRRSLLALSYIEQGVRLNLPLPKVVEAIGDAEGGRFKRDMDRCKLALEQGAPLAVVIGSIPRMPRKITAMIAFAERAGQLPRVMARIMEQYRDGFINRMDRRSFYQIYPWILIIVVISLICLLMTFVVPKFEVIFRDFHTTLPKMTLIMLSVARRVGPLKAFILIVVCVIILVNKISSIWSGEQFRMDRGLIWRITNHLPWIGPMRLHRELGDVLDLVADSVETGRPLDVSLEEVAQITANPQLKNEIETWIAAMRRGESVSKSASTANMPKLVCGMLAAGIQSPDMTLVLRFLSRYYRTRFSRTAILLRAATVPAVAIGMGLVVGWVALSMFTPLITLINSVSAYHSKGL